MPFHIIRDDITRLHVDAIVNAANTSLLGGGGVDGAIHRAAGPQLLEYCRGLGGCEVGQAKLSPGFRLPAKWVIHTVGPVWQGGKRGEEGFLSACYRNSLALALERGMSSVAFPLISAGAYGYPKDQALDLAVREIGGFLLEHEMDVTLVVFDEKSYQLSAQRFKDIRSYIDRFLPDTPRTPRNNRMERDWARASMEKQTDAAAPAPSAPSYAQAPSAPSGQAPYPSQPEPLPEHSALPSAARASAKRAKKPLFSRLRRKQGESAQAAEADFESASAAQAPQPIQTAAREDSAPGSPFPAALKPVSAEAGPGAEETWICPGCKGRNIGRYCSRCGSPRPLEAQGFFAEEALEGASAMDLSERLRQLDESFSQMLLRKIDESGMSDAACYKRANVDRKLFSKIRSDPNYRPSKPTVLAFAIALELSLPETRELLMKAGFALSHSSKFDVIIEYFILHRNYNIFEINEALFAFDQNLLGA